MSRSGHVNSMNLCANHYEHIGYLSPSHFGKAVDGDVGFFCIRRYFSSTGQSRSPDAFICIQRSYAAHFLFFMGLLCVNNHTIGHTLASLLNLKQCRHASALLLARSALHFCVQAPVRHSSPIKPCTMSGYADQDLI